ncbi:MAG: hypothetical protein LBI71_09240 [Enterobacteriaceae bacterium]|jgi:hypothetical protein|nr:hypothetical protein [Enterobacteriaceae bacterium]
MRQTPAPVWDTRRKEKLMWHPNFGHHATGDFFLNVGGKTTIKSQGEITFESVAGFKATAPEFSFSQ